MTVYGPHYIQGKWCVTPYNFVDEVQAGFRLPKKFHVRDTTLREGDEQPFSNALLPPKNKLTVAHKLYELGIREMELGYPGPVDEHFEAIRLIKGEIPDMKVTAFARVWVPEWKREIDRCVNAGVDGVDILDWASDIHLDVLGLERKKVLARDVESIEYARTSGREVNFAPIDALRTEWEYMKELYTTATRVGVDRLTVYEDGYGAPPAVRYFVGKLKDLVKDVPVLFHGHNDLGLGTANTLAAVEGGAEVVDLVLNGMGDKAGITAMEEVVVCLESLYGIKTGIKLEMLYEASRFLQEFTGVKLQPHKPVVGSNMFVHESELHAYTILKGCWEAMEPYRAEVVGQQRRVIFGDTTLHGLAARTQLDNLGLKYTDADVERIIDEVRKELQHKDYVSLEEFSEVAKRMLR